MKLTENLFLMFKIIRDQMNKIKKWGCFLNENVNTDFKKGDKVLVNPEIIKTQMEYYENLVRKSLGKHFKKEIHMADENTKLYEKAVNSNMATITWVERSKNDGSMVVLIFDDGFECSTTKTSISKACG